MKATRLSLIAALSALALTAGCGKKAPKDLPPPPMTGGETGHGNDVNGTGVDQGTVGQTGLGGLRADFVRAAGSDRIFFGTDEYGIDDEDRRERSEAHGAVEQHLVHAGEHDGEKQ